MRVTKQKTLKELHTYHLTPEIKYLMEYRNGKETSRDLVYKGKKLRKYPLTPIYNFDVNYLKEDNPYWRRRRWDLLKNKNLPDPENIDINKIILGQYETHSFFTLKKKPIPVVYEANYFHNGALCSKNYDLKKLKNHLQNHPNVVRYSSLLEVPWYNTDIENYYFTFLIYPKVEWLEKMYELDESLSYITGHPGDDKNPDYLGIKKFEI